ncbi:(+)-neomenthol dehydrogenase-like [Gossypium australe]|uniref:(+)-neomenthol dehydrogenase-like n=1 Tax=Gossypium australe TaxID=47621 RepID=A0A5B6W5P1_9ROSI|nr:(+)-neomenthol dehydrogenase-like [Gossypium australe]
MALVDWEAICQPQVCGGLSLKHLQDQNTSFLLKLGVNLISNKDALWVRLLRSKYGMKETIPESITRGSCSAMWRAIVKSEQGQRSNVRRIAGYPK